MLFKGDLVKRISQLTMNVMHMDMKQLHIYLLKKYVCIPTVSVSCLKIFKLHWLTSSVSY